MQSSLIKKHRETEALRAVASETGPEVIHMVGSEALKLHLTNFR